MSAGTLRPDPLNPDLLGPGLPGEHPVPSTRDPSNATATLHLLPVPIADACGLDVIPAATRAAAHALRHFVAENTRSARRALRDLGHPGPLQTLEIGEIPALKDGSTPDPAAIGRLLAPLAAGHSVGVLSESGCPGIADPGSEVVAWAQTHGFRVVAHVGPSSLLLALMGSGLQGQRFAFHGYLPVDPQARCARIRALETLSAREDATQIFIETPYRNAVMLASLLETLQDDTRLALACDLTGPAELLRTQSVAAWRGNALELPRLPTVFLIQRAQGSVPAPVLKSPRLEAGGRRRSAAGPSRRRPGQAPANVREALGRSGPRDISPPSQAQANDLDRAALRSQASTASRTPESASSPAPRAPRPKGSGKPRRRGPPRGGPTS